MRHLIGTFLIAMSGQGFAAESGHHLDFLASIAQGAGLDAHLSPLIGSLLVTLLVLGFGFFFRASCERRCQRAAEAPADLSPASKPNLLFFIENICDFVVDLCKDQCGKKWQTFLPLLGSLFIFILLANLSGLVPGIVPPTQNFSINLGLSLPVFLFYNWAGIKEHGVHYVKQFMGPILGLVPLFICLEIITHVARPLSLSFRLQANIFGDHLLLAVFSSMAPLVVPAVLLLFGLLVACIQSFVFTMLTAIYINMAISHDH